MGNIYSRGGQVDGEDVDPDMQCFRPYLINPSIHWLMVVMANKGVKCNFNHFYSLKPLALR